MFSIVVSLLDICVSGRRFRVLAIGALWAWRSILAFSYERRVQKESRYRARFDLESTTMLRFDLAIFLNFSSRFVLRSLIYCTAARANLHLHFFALNLCVAGCLIGEAYFCAFGGGYQ